MFHKKKDPVDVVVNRFPLLLMYLLGVVRRFAVRFYNEGDLT